jgi:hypothetical protein
MQGNVAVEKYICIKSYVVSKYNIYTLSSSLMYDVL